jgi:hypothetical protein
MKEQYKNCRENIKDVRDQIKKFKTERKKAKDKVFFISFGFCCFLNIYNIWDLYKKRIFKFGKIFKRVFFCFTIPLAFNYIIQYRIYKYYRKKEKEVILKNFS